MNFNENTRVKIPAILHLARLGYQYLSLSRAVWNKETNIFTDIFSEAILRINEGMEAEDVKRVLQDVDLALSNEDVGKTFYEMLTAVSGKRLIDFENFENNSFHVVTELTYKNGDDEFRPDITLLINGMPLVFIEVKKPNNRDGILAERVRINDRFKNKQFIKFINISQILVFSNNMEYVHEDLEPLQGAFYASPAYKAETRLNYFREEETLNLDSLLRAEDEDLENFVLSDNNLNVIKNSPEFLTNKNPNTPTNRISTSLFSKERLAMLLKYGIAYVKKADGKVEKHIMRYPQIFASKAIENTLNKDIRKGIIWHTQGSGKTALAFYNVKYLTDYYQKKNIIPKFYFIVDRIDLLNQATDEFVSRGLTVHKIDSREDLLKDFKSQQAVSNLFGKLEITVVNIQKFKDQSDIVISKDYATNIQRVYFVDEAHRGYPLTGSFLANLASSDRNAVLIALTGTPLIAEDKKSVDIFGDYIHKYYYNDSIADGYTLRLIREDIETGYKIRMVQALKDIQILKGDIEQSKIFAEPVFAEPMLDYIVEDFINSGKNVFSGEEIGGMVVCDSSEQAKKLFEIFINKYHPEQETVEDVATNYKVIKEASPIYAEYVSRQGKKLKAALILHDIGSKADRKEEVENFKNGKIDLLFVYNMLLTGFDAPRLKKLYMARLVRDHNLLQTLTRVNRPYKNIRYGYVVDFVDIEDAFKQTNRNYFDELKKQYGDELQNYSDMLMSRAEIEKEIGDIKDKLFYYDLNNAEVFSQQINQIDDRKTILDIKRALESARNLYNLIRLYEHKDLLEKLDFDRLHSMLHEVRRRLDLLNLRESLKNNIDTTNLLNAALENIVFTFRKKSEEELQIADELSAALRKTREALNANIDPLDPQYVSLLDELKRVFTNRNLDEVSQTEMRQNIGTLEKIYEKVLELNRRNNLLRAKYENDAKYARLHKRIVERGLISKREIEVQNILLEIKHKADAKVLLNQHLLNTDAFFTQTMMELMVSAFNFIQIPLKPDAAKFMNGLLVKEYINEFQGNI
ncbi:MAG: HsdR family type I site-specific deoxyribonuclease [Chloroflexi bacterium OLB14]|nr:MAG: HsdR family type I site-specific deoxyribonuclease [Chloroflexi bacterium OLB14]